jgi:hypothetical protein
MIHGALTATPGTHGLAVKSATPGDGPNRKGRYGTGKADDSYKLRRLQLSSYDEYDEYNDNWSLRNLYEPSALPVPYRPLRFGPSPGVALFTASPCVTTPFIKGCLTEATHTVPQSMQQPGCWTQK